MKNITAPANQLTIPATYNQSQKGLFDIASDVVQQGVSLMSRYTAMCNYIRTNQMTTKEVTPILVTAGFLPQRASEIARVAYVSDELWEQQQAAQIGWTIRVKQAREESHKRGKSKPRTNYTHQLYKFVADWLDRKPKGYKIPAKLEFNGSITMSFTTTQPAPKQSK